MSEASAPTVPTIDARGMRCPWPALQAARAMRSHASIVLIADDPKAEGEVRALAAQHGWSVELGQFDTESVTLTLAA